MKINFVVKVNKLGTYYFYLSNLALEGKKFWVRKNYNDRFLLNTGLLNKEEKKLLLKFQKTIIMLEKQRKPMHLADFFYAKKTFGNLKHNVAGKDYQIILQIFKVFKKRWVVFWNKELKNEVENCKKNLERNIKINKRYIKKTIKSLNILYGVKQNCSQNITIFLIPLPKDIKNNGGKIIPPLSAISIESSSETAGKRRIIEIIMHELTHLLFENEKIDKIYHITEKRLLKNQKEYLIKPFCIPSVSFGLKEIIANSVILSQVKHRKMALNSPYLKLLDFVSQKLQPEIRYYIKRNKTIDEVMIKKALVFWRLFLNKNRVA